MNIIKIHSTNLDQLTYNTIIKSLTNDLIPLAYKHHYYCFAIVGSKDLFFRLIHYQDRYFSLSIEPTKHPEAYLAIMSANLINLRNLIIDCSNSSANDIRLFANDLHSLLESDGHHQLFSSVSKEKKTNELGYRLISK